MDNALLIVFLVFIICFLLLITGLVGVHLVFLHEYGSNNPLGVHFKVDSIPMYPYYIIKDLYGVILFLMFLLRLYFLLLMHWVIQIITFRLILW